MRSALDHGRNKEEEPDRRFRGHHQREHEPVVATDHLHPRLLSLDTHYHRFRLLVVRIPCRSGDPCIPVAVYREQLECCDHRHSVCLGGASFLLVGGRRYELTWW